MIISGVKLMVLGMGVVYLFLGLLVVAVHCCARLLRNATERELAAAREAAERAKRGGKGKGGAGRANPARTTPEAAPADAGQDEEERRRLVAVIAAALAAHRAAEGRRRP